MRKLLALALAVTVVACNTKTPEPAAAAPENTTAHQYSVKARYSSDWEIGDPELAEKVITFWKHFDNNTLDSVRAYFSDSVYMEMPGFSGKLQSDSALAGAKAERARFSSLKSEIDALIPVNSKDHPDEKIVTIWGEEIGVLDGKEIKRKAHETWAFNKEGKVMWMIRFEGYKAP
jgi:hypothetical protein